MNNKLQFTRYLYNKDEVELTLLEAILKNKDFNEIYFWTLELYKSNDPEELWQFIFKMYYDFYYVSYPNFIKKIISYYNKSKKNNKIKYVLFIIYNLKRASKHIDFNIFLSRTYFSSRLTYIIKNIDLTPFNGNLHQKLLSFAIKTNKNKLIAYYLKKVINLKNIEEFLKLEFNICLKNNDPYNNKFHKYLVLCLNIPKLEKKFIFKKVPENAYIDVEEKLKIKENIHYKILKTKRLYEISDKIGCFSLIRSNYLLNKEFWYHWEFHAFQSLLWQKRFNKYNIKVNKRKKEIEFLDDDEMEEFYQKFGYEPDEQTKEIQEKSIKKIKSISFNNWLTYLGKELSDVNKIEKKLKY